MKRVLACAGGLVVALCAAVASAEVVFFDSFENPTAMGNWTEWWGICPPDKPPVRPVPCYYGPYKLFQSDNHPHSGVACARQEQAQPWWYGSKLVTPLTLPNDRTIRLSVWQFEDFNKQDPFPTPTSHDQVQGWVVLTGDDGPPGAPVGEAEFLAVGVHAHTASPPPISDWWHNVAWATATEGWNLTNPLIPRAQGFRHIEIVVHPYTGAVGDVEFFVDGIKVGQGSRKPGYLGTGVPIKAIALGSHPAHMTEDYISNTYEFFWYDDVKLSVGAVADFDGDADTDLTDFSHFQGCFNGPNRPAADPANCVDADFDSDNDVDLTDFGAFQACFNGPNRPPAC